MRFSPDEASLDDFGPTESSNFFEQDSEQLLAVSVAGNPGRPHVSVAKSAEVDDRFFGDTKSDIGLT